MNLLVAALWLAALAALIVGALAWRRRTLRGALALGLLMACIAHGGFFYSLGLLAPDLAWKVWWNHVEYALAVWIPGLLLALGAQQARRDGWLRPECLAVLFGPAALALAANWSNDWHHLYYSATRLESDGGMTFLIKERGPLYWMFQVYSMGATGATAYILFVHWYQAARFYRGQSLALLLASALPFLLNLMYLLRIGPLHRATLAYLGLLATALLLGWAVLRGRLLQLSPVARTALLENMAEAMLVLDGQGRITDFNLKAAQWFGCSEAVLGQPPAVLPGLKVPENGAEESVSGVFTLGTRWFRGISTPLNYASGRNFGHLLLYREVTRQQKSRLALQSAYRRLRELLRIRSLELQRATAQAARIQEEEQRRIGRELHDTLCQDLAGLARTAESLAARAAETEGGALGQDLRQMALQAGQMLRSAREFAHDLALADLGNFSLAEALEAFAEHAQPWLGVHVEVNFAPEIRIEEPEAAWHLLRIVREAVVNAARHGQARQAWVDVIRRPGQIILSVSNNGRPLPDQGAIQEGLGLRAMRMRARLLGGELSLQNTPNGMVLVQMQLSEAMLCLPSEERVAPAPPGTAPMKETHT